MELKQENVRQRCESKFDQRRILEFEKMRPKLELTLQELAHAHGVTIAFIQSFIKEKAIYYIQHNQDTSKQNSLNHFPTITNEADNKIEALFGKTYQR